MRIVLVCIGQLQPYIRECIRQLHHYNNHDIVVLTDTEDMKQQLHECLESFTSSSPPVVIEIVDLSRSDLASRFEQESILPTSFRGGFFRHCFKRFIVIFEYLSSHRMTNVLHFENDIMVYRDCEEWRPFLDKEIHLVMDSHDRCVPSVMFFRDDRLLGECLRNHGVYSDKNDMYFWGSCFQVYRGRIGTLPITTTDAEYTPHLGVFDGAAIGQYLGGIDPRNTPIPGQNSTGFVNETCREKYDRHSFEWHHDADHGVWYPVMDDEIRINNLHIHSKNLGAFTSHPESLEHLQTALSPIRLDFMSGERFQDLASHFVYLDNPYSNVTAPMISAADPRYVRITPETPLDNSGVLYINSMELYPFLLTHPKLVRNPFVIMAHNSDQNFHVDVNDHLLMAALDHSNCRGVYTQNPGGDDHPKVHMLPIGFANSKWPHGNPLMIECVLTTTALQTLPPPPHKIKNIYFFFSESTNPPVRTECRRVLSQQAKIEWTSSVQMEYMAYLRTLSEHRYGVCPEGNGLDTHRLWECIALQVIPIMKQSAFTERVRRFLHPYPMMIVDKWEDVDPDRLQREYRFPRYPFYNISTMHQRIQRHLFSPS